MPTIRTTRQVTRTVTNQVTDNLSSHADITTSVNRHGSLDVHINGQLALRLTTSGYLRRFPGLTDRVGFFRTEDGRIAMKAADGAAE